MGKSMFEERTYEKKQEIEVRAARGGHVQHWVKARIESLTSKGAHVTILDSKRYTHIGWRDMRKIGDTSKDTAVVPEVAAPAKSTFSNHVLSPEKVASLQKPAIEKPVATVTPIRPIIEEQPEVVVENSQRLVNVSKMRRNAARTSNPLLAGLLKNAREMENLTQQDVADLIESSQVMVSRFERGETAPDDDLLFAYADKLGTDLDLLLLARDQPEEAKNYKPKATPVVLPNALPNVAPMEIAKPREAPTMIQMPPEPKKPTPAATLAMDDFFEFCDKMELICPQPTEPALRKQWRELAQGLFNLRSKL